MWIVAILVTGVIVLAITAPHANEWFGKVIQRLIGKWWNRW